MSRVRVMQRSKRVPPAPREAPLVNNVDGVQVLISYLRPKRRGADDLFFTPEEERVEQEVQLYREYSRLYLKVGDDTFQIGMERGKLKLHLQDFGSIVVHPIVSNVVLISTTKD